MTYADIILPLPLDSLFTYSVPDSLAGRVGQGIRVLVPFGKSKTYVGWWLGHTTTSPTSMLRTYLP